MTDLRSDLAQAVVPARGVRLYWLGQASFAFRTANGRRVFLDPYLSDACERLHGFKRLSLPAMRLHEVEADWIWAEYNNIASNATFNAFGPVISPLSPPAAPSGLVAVSVTTNQIQLAWTDSATDETGYVVERSPTWAATLLPANATNYTDTGLVASTLYDYRVAATNAAGRSAYATISVATLSPWTQWQRDQFGAQAGQPDLAGPEADPDSDGIVNRLEYALRGHPLQADLVLPVAQRVGDHLRLTYRRNKAATDLAYEVQGRDSLSAGDWQPIDPSQEVLRIDQDGYWEITVEDPADMRTVPSRFLRLKVSQP